MAAGAVSAYKILWRLFGFCALILIYRTCQTRAGLASVLYTDNDNVLLLNQSNFAATLFHKDRAFIIEFYNSYCGHCIRYAPTWIAFAADIKDWKTVVAPGVVDCANNANLQICQDYDVPAFPTVKHFWTDLSPESRGEDIPHKDVESVRHNLIDFLTKNAAEKGSPNSWPMLQATSAPTLKEIWQSLPLGITSFLLLIEAPDSYVGRETMLDFSGTEARILRMETSNTELYIDLTSNVNIQTVPALVLLRRNSKPESLWTASSVRAARSEFRTAIQVALHISIDTEPKKDMKNSTTDLPDTSPDLNVQTAAQMVDLENTLDGILRQEVALKKELSGDKLVAFKSFLAALTKSFPGRAPVMNFLRGLYKWVSEQNQYVNMNSMQRFINNSQRADSYLPHKKDWVGCKGSVPKYRGYSCGLWTLFHSMTVKSFYLYEQGEMVNPQQVLFAIKNYILEFFGCSECAEHFQAMSMIMEQEAQHPNDTVIWLWNAHNKVNQRLKGDATEDPRHPKVPFPPPRLCPTCRHLSRSGLQLWKLPNVLRFMRHYYLDDISQYGVVSFEGMTRGSHEPSGGGVNKAAPSGWNFHYFSGLDISLCVLLYMVSMVLLIVMFLLFRLRRRKVKRKNVCYKVEA